MGECVKYVMLVAILVFILVIITNLVKYDMWAFQYEKDVCFHIHSYIADEKKFYYSLPVIYWYYHLRAVFHLGVQIQRIQPCF